MPVFETIFRKKFIAVDPTPPATAPTLDDLIRSLRQAADYLEQMRAAGLVLADHGNEDDYHFLTTEDPKIAEQFDMHPIPEDECEDGDEDLPPIIDEWEEGPTAEEEAEHGGPTHGS